MARKIECPKCGGSGDCFKCDGTGVIHHGAAELIASVVTFGAVGRGSEECSSCEGTGKCRKCQGRGEIREE